MKLKKLLFLALGAFAIGTESYALAGLLPAVAGDLGVTVALAGQLITAFALAYALGSPLLAVATAGVERKRLLLGSIVTFGLFNVLAALSHTYAMLFVSRIGMALSAGIFMPAASAYAVAASPANQRGRALSIIYSGLTVATLIGVPLGVLVGERLGWRSIFLGAAALAAAAAVGLGLNLATSRGGSSVSLAERIAIARRPDVLGALIVTVIALTGAFSIYTYIAPFLHQATGLTGDSVALVLFLFGAGSTVGNLVAGSLSDRIGPYRVLLAVVGGLIVLFSALSLTSTFLPSETARWIIVPVIAIWGAVGFSFPSTQQSRLVAMEPRLAPITLSLNASAIYLGISLGAVLGSLVVSHSSIVKIGWLGAACEVLALTALLLAPRRRVVPAAAVETLPASLPEHA
jgi:predicted MFS family arabinose efflux permease